MLYGYAGIDFGQDNDDDDQFRSFVSVYRGDSEAARQGFAFPGADVELSRYLGRRGETVMFEVDMIARDDAYLVAFGDAMRAAKQSPGTYSLMMRGVTYPRVIIEQFGERGPRVPLWSPWSYGQRWSIRFRILP